MGTILRAMDDRYSALHPITRLRLKHSPPLTTAEVAARAKLERWSVSKVEYGHRDHPGFEACRALVQAFPKDLSLDALGGWRWTARARRQARSLLSEMENGRNRRRKAS